MQHWLIWEEKSVTCKREDSCSEETILEVEKKWEEQDLLSKAKVQSKKKKLSTAKVRRVLYQDKHNISLF